MKDPKVTVLLCVYNGEKYLREAIDSILNQTFENFEFLVINDASTDSSRDIILSYKDPRIRLIDNKKNLGLTRSLNKGLKLAKGEYIARIDADDIAFPERLKRQLEYIVKRPDVGGVSSWYEVVDERGGLVYVNKVALSFEDIYYNLTFFNCLVHSSTLYNKKLVLDMGGYDENYKRSQDYELWCRISKISRIEQVPEALVKLRLTNTTISRKFQDEQDRYAREVFRSNIENLLSRKIGEEERHIWSLWSHNNVIKTKNVDLKRVLAALCEINKKIIETADPSLNMEIQKIKANGLEKVTQYLLNSAKRGKLFDVFLSILTYPQRKELIIFLFNRTKK